MKFYFGPAAKNENTEDLFEHNGKFFYFKVDADEEGFTIYDTCDRAVPLDMNNLDALIDVLSYIRDYNKVRDFGLSYFDKLFDSLAKVYSLEGRSV